MTTKNKMEVVIEEL